MSGTQRYIKLLRYKQQYKHQLLKVLDSNLGKYFDASERQEFLHDLDALEDTANYFVSIVGNEVVACGGYLVSSNVASLSWGMVHRDFHTQGIGSKLTNYRLVQILDDKVIQIVKIDTSQHTEGFYAKRGYEVTNTVINGH